MYCVKFDVYYNNQYIVTRVVQFLSKLHATRCINKWSNYRYSYRNVKSVDRSEYDPTNPNHFIHNYDLNLA